MGRGKGENKKGIENIVATNIDHLNADCLERRPLVPKVKSEKWKRDKGYSSSFIQIPNIFEAENF